MQKIKIIQIISVLVFITSFLNFNTMAQTEKQKYSVLHKDGDFEIRRYEPAIMASVEMPGSYGIFYQYHEFCYAFYLSDGRTSGTKE